MMRGLFYTTCVALALMVSPALAVKITIDRPGEREFIRDQADMVTPEDEAKIKEIADKLLTEKAVPIVVVTINSMAESGGADMRIETFARFLFDQWGIGVPELPGQVAWNRGILLLVSKVDRKARIELGAGWKRDKDDLALKIMDEQIISRFKQGDFSGGILQGVVALDAMGRELKLPSKPVDKRQAILGAVVIGLLIFTVISLIRRGSGGWAWLMWGAFFGLIGMMLYSFLTNRGGGSSGGFSGGSFGGGFSGGGGATGSW